MVAELQVKRGKCSCRRWHAAPACRRTPCRRALVRSWARLYSWAQLPLPLSAVHLCGRGGQGSCAGVPAGRGRDAGRRAHCSPCVSAPGRLEWLGDSTGALPHGQPGAAAWEPWAPTGCQPGPLDRTDIEPVIQSCCCCRCSGSCSSPSAPPCPPPCPLPYCPAAPPCHPVCHPSEQYQPSNQP